MELNIRKYHIDEGEKMSAEYIQALTIVTALELIDIFIQCPKCLVIAINPLLF